MTARSRSRVKFSRVPRDQGGPVGERGGSNQIVQSVVRGSMPAMIAGQALIIVFDNAGGRPLAGCALPGG